MNSDLQGFKMLSELVAELKAESQAQQQAHPAQQAQGAGVS